MEISSEDARIGAAPRSRGPAGHGRQARRFSYALIVLTLLALAGAPGAFAASKPVITKQPTSLIVEAGQSATFKAEATGTPNPTVQWEVANIFTNEWKPISKATSTTYTIAKTNNSENSLEFRARFKNSAGEAVTEAATLTVGQKPVVTKNPSNQTVGFEVAARFEAEATSSPLANIQWEQSTNGGAEWTAMAGKNLPYLEVTPTGASYNGYEYRARFTNVLGTAVTTAAILMVHAIAEVTQQPQEEALVLAGESVSFESASAHGFPIPTVQWQVSSNAGSTWSNVEGATSDLLTLSPTTVGENGDEYRAAFINSAGTAYSHAATLWVAANNYSAFGWGLNNHGQVGIGSNESSIVAPMPINGLSFVKAVSGGMRHSLALLDNDTVEAWGYDGRGQLGNEGAISTRTPILVENLHRVIQVAAGGSHSLALLENGTVLAWGDDESGQLGNGHNTDSEIPVPVEGLTGVTAIAAGEEFSLALLSNGHVMSWGNGERGQLGANGKASHNSPQEVKNLSGVEAIAAGGQFSMALLENGTVVAWGDDRHGQLGSKSFLEEPHESQEEGPWSPSPVAVEKLTGVTQIAAGRTHALALLSNGTVAAWGNDAEGELGNGAIETQADTPVAVSGLAGVTAISAGDQESAALLTTGSVEAWGGNGNGTLGIGTTGAPSDLPVEVHSIGGAAGISAGASQVLAFGATLPSVSSISPTTGPAAGGTSVTITGSDIGTATAVHFGTAAATGVVVNSSTSVTAIAPAGSGTVNVTVTTPTGTSPNVSGDRFTYKQPPTVLKLSAKAGPAAGGTMVTITGTEFAGATEVVFGSVGVTNLTVSGNSLITVVTPADVGGKLAVKVVTPGGTSAPSTKAVFKFVPSVESVSPANGPIAGGTSVTITGTGFVPGTTGTLFKFGKGKVTTVECTSMTSCTALSPETKVTGTVDVTAASGKAKSSVSPADQFKYE